MLLKKVEDWKDQVSVQEGHHPAKARLLQSVLFARHLSCLGIQ